MVALAVGAGWAALRGAAGWLALAALASFVPVGFYLLLAPGPAAKVIGVADLVMLGAALGLRGGSALRPQ
jgi:hypothetical protein